MTPDPIHDLALRLSTAYALAKEAGHSEVDAWRNVALVVQRESDATHNDAIEDAKRVSAEFSDYCDAVAKEFGSKGDWANAESWRAFGRGAFMLRSSSLDRLLQRIAT